MSGADPDSRRNFLFGRVSSALRRIETAGASGADSGTDGAAGIEGADEAAARGNGGSDWLLEFTRDAMACRWQVLLDPDGPTDRAEGAIDALALLDPLEDQLSVYRESSEISRLNRTAATDWVSVEERLYELLETGRRLHRLTDGAFDMTAGPLSRVWGFHRREGRVPTAEELREALSRVGTDRVEFDAARRAIRYLVPGIEINLGGIGKGHALDRVVERLIGWGVRDVLVHGGQSSVAARGRRRAGAEGWLVGLSHPVWPGRRLAEIRLQDEALGTSGTGRQHFYHQGKRYGHILDPRTGMPSDALLSATVIAPTAAEADAAATACHVLGEARSIRLIESQPNWRGLLAVADGARDRVRLVPIRLDGRWERLE
ncbi:MAG TPA: FAD:protein FMN transferase [Pirellulaceae bacterium]|nr:FAD:protein FMN transferase [Pirellulaceae bacterium]